MLATPLFKGPEIGVISRSMKKHSALIGKFRKSTVALSLVTGALQLPVIANAGAPRCEGAFNVEATRQEINGYHYNPFLQRGTPYVDESPLFAADPLLQTRRAQQKGDSSVLKGTEATQELFNAFLALKGDFLQDRSLVFDQAPSQVLRLIDYDSFKDYKTNHPRESAAKIYGVETIRAWKEADDYLASIPIGEFKMTMEVLHRVGGLSGRTLKPLPIKISHITPDDKGSFKFLPNSGRAPLREPLTEEQYVNLKQNKWLSGFLELPWPWSKPGSRRGIILYALPHTVEGKLTKLIEWYEQNKTTMDPIRLAVEFQRSFISIHPYVDGNGRASRLIMDRILMEHGLPPALILDHNMDLYSNIDAYEALVRMGVADSINLLKDEGYSRKAANRLELQVSDLNDNATAVTRKWANKALVAKYAELSNYKFQVGDRSFVLRNDGFIYDQFGIPHEYNNGRFYPIADRMTELYDFGGDTIETKARTQQYVGYNYRTQQYQYRTQMVDVIYKLLSPLKRGVFQKHLRIVEKIKNQEVSSKGLTVEPMQQVSKANLTAAPFVYPWQQEQFAQAFQITDETAEELLSPFYKADTTYVSVVRRGDKPSSTQTIAQYELLDMALYDYEVAARKQPKLVSAIHAYRERIHQKARSEINLDLEAFEKLSSADKAIAEKDFRFQLFKSYFAISKLSHPTLASAQAAGFDKFVPLMRNSNRMSTVFGFIPSPVIRSVLKKIPFFGQVIDWATALQKEVAERGEEVLFQKVKANKKLPEFVKKRLLAKLTEAKGTLSTALTGFVDEMTAEAGTQTPYSLPGDRRAWALKNRARGDDEGEIGLSFSTSPELYYNGAVFANGSGKQVVLSLVRAPRSAVIHNFVSDFSNEYEVVGLKPMFRNNLVKQFDGDQMKERGDFGQGSPELRLIMKDLLGISDNGGDQVDICCGEAVG